MIQMADQLVYKFFDMGLKMLENWTVSQLTKKAVTTSTTAAETAVVVAGQTAQAGAVIAGQAAQWAVVEALTKLGDHLRNGELEFTHYHLECLRASMLLAFRAE